MANINLYEAYNSKLNKYGLNGSATFEASFVEAVNMVYSELNDQVFQNQTLAYIDSFDDVIDNRLHFTDLTFDADANAALTDRKFWSIEWDLVRGSNVNGFTDTITEFGGDTLIYSVADGVFSIGGTVGDIAGTATLPDTDVWAITFESNADGNVLTVNGEPLEVTYTVGDATTAQAIGTISAGASEHVITADKIELIRTRFNSVDGGIYLFLVDDDDVTPLVDDINEYELTITGGSWIKVYIEPSSGLNNQYRGAFSIGLDFHLQDGGQWAIEPEQAVEARWYGMGIKMARSVYQHNSTYVPALGAGYGG